MPKPLIEPRWCSPHFHTADNQPALLPRILHERARRALYQNCERAPLGWDKMSA